MLLYRIYVYEVIFHFNRTFFIILLSCHNNILNYTFKQALQSVHFVSDTHNCSSPTMRTCKVLASSSGCYHYIQLEIETGIHVTSCSNWPWGDEYEASIVVD